MKIKTKELAIGFLLGVVTSVVGGYLMALFDHLYLRWNAPTIEVDSLSRLGAKEFLADEILRFRVVNRAPEHVIWLLDGKPLAGNTEIDQPFPFDPTQPKGIGAIHHVTALVQDGSLFEIAKTTVKVSNSRLAEAKVSLDNEHLAVHAKVSPEAAATISKAYLVAFDGKAYAKVPVTFEMSAQTPLVVDFVAKKADVESALKTTLDRIVPESKAQLGFEYGGTSAGLKTVQPLVVDSQ